jgi:hypothetical protein
MGRGVIALLAAGVALAAPAHALREQVVAARTVLATHRLPEKTVSSFTVACRTGYVASSAGVSRPAPGTSVLAIRPVDVRAYRFRIGNPADNGRQRVTVALACLGLAPADTTRYSLRLTTVKKQAVAPGRKVTGRSLTCPAGTVPAGGGMELDRSLALRRLTSSLSRFSFSAQNAGPQARRVVFYGNCLTLARAADAPRRRLHVNVSTFRVQVRPGSQTVGRSCRSGWLPLAAGYELRSKLTQVDGAAALGAGGRWSVTSDAELATTADLQLACGRLGR